MRSAADAKWDPRPGDILQKTFPHNNRGVTRWRREVIQRTGPHPGSGHEWVVCRNGSGHNAYMLPLFRKWAEHAEVIHVAN
jgi:hypothetical protein